MQHASQLRLDLPPGLFVDGGRPISVRLEQIYAPSIELPAPLLVRVALHKPGAGRGNQVGEKIQDVGAFEGVSRDLIDSPFLFDVDLSSLPDGRAIVRAEAFDGSQSLGAVTLALEVRRGLDRRLQQLESGAREVKGFEALRAEVLYPVDYLRNVDRGRIPRQQHFRLDLDQLRGHDEKIGGDRKPECTQAGDRQHGCRESAGG